jgi:hypothetical protein
LEGGVNVHSGMPGPVKGGYGRCTAASFQAVHEDRPSGCPKLFDRADGVEQDEVEVLVLPNLIDQPHIEVGSAGWDMAINHSA